MQFCFAVPPGIAVIEPKLSLSYNSQGGPLGVSRSLTGLPVIHRCPTMSVLDGQLQGVNYDANDRYCLDGPRLVAVNSAYGVDANEYRSETEGYSRIVSYGAQGNGPASWKVWTKSGPPLEYGNTVVSSAPMSDGTGGSHVTNYTYAEVESRHRGVGFLGFRHVAAYHPLRRAINYRQDYPHQGQHPEGHRQRRTPEPKAPSLTPTSSSTRP